MNPITWWKRFFKLTFLFMTKNKIIWKKERGPENQDIDLIVKNLIKLRRWSIPVSHHTHHQVAKYWAHQQGKLGYVNLPGRVAHQVPLKYRQKTERSSFSQFEILQEKGSKHQDMQHFECAPKLSSLIKFLCDSEIFTFKTIKSWENTNTCANVKKQQQQTNTKLTNTWESVSMSSLTEINSFPLMGQWTYHCSSPYLKHSQGLKWRGTACSLSAYNSEISNPAVRLGCVWKVFNNNSENYLLSRHPAQGGRNGTISKFAWLF